MIVDILGELSIAESFVVDIDQNYFGCYNALLGKLMFISTTFQTLLRKAKNVYEALGIIR